MKKTILFGVGLAAACLLTACGSDPVTTAAPTNTQSTVQTAGSETTAPTTPAHEHSFAETVKEEGLKSAATCTEPAVYYKSCQCGEKSDETFVSGEALGHDYDDTTGKCGREGCRSYYSVGLAYTLNEKGDGYIVSGIGTCTETDIVIPEVYNGKPVTEIGDEAFMGEPSESETEMIGIVTSVVIPNSVTTIGEYAFSGSTDMTKVVIPDSVTKMESGAFWFCGLTEVTISKNLTELESAVFGMCRNLEKIVVPDNITSLNGGVFFYCTALTDITLPDTLTNIGGFFGPDFGETAYYKNPENWEDGVLYVGNYLIEAKPEVLSGTYTVKAGTKAIAQNAFDGCVNLTRIELPDGLNAIGNKAFLGCTGLTQMTIPESVTRIESHLFGDCTNLTGVTLHDGITSIGASVFSECSSLTSITFNGTKEQWNSIEKDDRWYDNWYYDDEVHYIQCTIHCTDGDINIVTNNE